MYFFERSLSTDQRKFDATVQEFLVVANMLSKRKADKAAVAQVRAVSRANETALYSSTEARKKALTDIFDGFDLDASGLS